MMELIVLFFELYILYYVHEKLFVKFNLDIRTNNELKHAQYNSRTRLEEIIVLSHDKSRQKR